jgi:hypothetical protein
MNYSLLILITPELLPEVILTKYKPLFKLEKSILLIVEVDIFVAL